MWSILHMKGLKELLNASSCLELRFAGFPLRNKMVDTKIKSCLACQAAIYVPTRDPLKQTKLPDRPWQCIDMDFWGPLPNGEYLLVMIDEYTRYPEVEFPKSTSSQAVIQHIDRDSTHRFPDSVRTDGGPPFSDNANHEHQMYVKWAGVQTIVVSPEDQWIGWELYETTQQSVAHCPDWGKECKTRDTQIPATLQGNTIHKQWQSPSWAPVQPKLHARCALRSYRSQYTTPKYANEMHKSYKDSKTNVKHHSIRVNDKVLLLQRQSKTKSRYDPITCKVVKA